MKKTIIYLTMSLALVFTQKLVNAQKKKVKVYNFYTGKAKMKGITGLLNQKKSTLIIDTQKDEVQYNCRIRHHYDRKDPKYQTYVREKFPGYETSPYKFYTRKDRYAGHYLFYTPEGYWLYSRGHNKCGEERYNRKANTYPSVLMTEDKMKGEKLSPKQILEKIIKAHNAVCENINKAKEEVARKKAAKVYLPKPTMRNQDFEQKIVAAANHHARRESWKETFTKAIITSNDWGIIRRKYTGAITGRILEAACVAKWPDGHCTYQYFNFEQAYTGGGKYQKLSL